MRGEAEIADRLGWHPDVIRRLSPGYRHALIAALSELDARRRFFEIQDRRVAAAPRKLNWQYELNLIHRAFASDREAHLAACVALSAASG